MQFLHEVCWHWKKEYQLTTLYLLQPDLFFSHLHFRSFIIMCRFRRQSDPFSNSHYYLDILRRSSLCLKIFYFCLRLSRWNHTKIFSDFGDEETEDVDSAYMDAETAPSSKSKVSAMAKSKASSRSV